MQEKKSDQCENVWEKAFETTWVVIDKNNSVLYKLEEVWENPNCGTKRSC